MIFWAQLNISQTDMPRQSYRNLIICSYVISMFIRTIFAPPMENIREQATLLVANLLVDLEILCEIQTT